MGKRIWVDTLVANECCCINDLRRLIEKGYTLIVASTAVDVRLFQENLQWFEQMLVEAKIIIEVWNTPDEMVSKHFYWSSCKMASSPSASLAEAVQRFSNKAEIIDIAKMIELYGFEKGQWEQGPWAPPQPISEEIATALGISPETTDRSTVFQAAKLLCREDLFDKYNAGYCIGLAKQHCCIGMINANGNVTFF